MQNPIAGGDNQPNQFKQFDQIFQANLGKISSGLSPAGLMTAYFAWMMQLLQAPGTLLQVGMYLPMHLQEHVDAVLKTGPLSQEKDPRFQGEEWQALPWRFLAENFLFAEQWWKQATSEIPGLDKHLEEQVAFYAKQSLEALSPANNPFLNPKVVNETIATKGENLVKGMQKNIQDVVDGIERKPAKGSENFIPGKQVAITPGKVVFSNHLIELLQYEAKTTDVYKEPILICPNWIMKYYILDLSPENSMVKWLVSQGHTVFMISWLNPDDKDAYIGMDDYFRQGIMAAIDAVSSACPKAKINLMGYCIGGTLAMIAAAAMGRDNDKRLNSLTLLAAQGDFTEAGEIKLFTDRSEISFLNSMMAQQGGLDSGQMAGSFQLLRSYDMIWAKITQSYMKDTEKGMIDLLAWNSDATRMPYKMHSEYLEKLYLNNDLATGRFSIEGKHIALSNVNVPVFLVGTEKDHVAPWKSVYKMHLMIHQDIMCVLTSGGHNAGIVSEPGHAHRSYRMHHHKASEPYLGIDEWSHVAVKKEGSWWLAWNDWLVSCDSKDKTNPAKLDSKLPAAPGTYVLRRV
jgi:polyhydroxyalkanoate synthase subunit PhaC